MYADKKSTDKTSQSRYSRVLTQTKTLGGLLGLLERKGTMLVFQGHGGFIACLIAGVVAVGLGAMGAPAVVTYGLAGAAMVAFGFWINGSSDEQHTLFWIPIQYWGIVVAISGLFAPNA